MTKPSPTQHYLNLADIKDGCLVLRNGEVRQVLIVSALNFALKSEQEQSAIIYQYQAFLNSLPFSIQIVVQSRQLDLTTYLAKLKTQAEQTTNLALKAQMLEYLDFVGRLVTLGNIMEKRFYVVIPYATAAARTRSLFGQLLKRQTVFIEEAEFKVAKAKLDERAESIRQGLGSMGLVANVATKEEVAKMLYQTYNPIETGEVAVSPLAS